ncbi:DUF815 domain-containing protein [Erythrobacter sp. Alg231-14]|uniref:DUF815 domain-containing protein n=1 Tax=Erythrobacter sp. Alg231-14 TaxID=1922225 RepID=UPI000D5527AF
MTDNRIVLERIADALERLAPAAVQPTDWTSATAFVWDGQSARAVLKHDCVEIDRLRGIDKQKTAVCDNLARLKLGAAAHDMLLWGSRGMGKSALIRAAVASAQERHPGALTLVQIAPNSLDTLPLLIEDLAKQSGAFLLFVDDLGFDADHAQDNLALRSLLDGGLVSRPPNVRIAVSSNRRAIVARDADTNDLLHERDERDNALALADRFGLTLGFHPCDQSTFLEILHAYTDPLGLEVDAEEANAWAISRGSRSGRTAYQFAVELAGRAGLPL